jgi:AcrR family transcriptional regulator
MSRRTRTEIDVGLFRERILDVAEEHFRRIGYQKTSVADIAFCLGMSSASIYRYFPSRAEINAAICGRFVAETVQSADTIARIPAAARQRLKSVLVALHQKRKTMVIEERAVHDLIVVATEENWAVIRAHAAQILALVETIVRQGAEAGEFSIDDAARAARSIMNAFLPFYHPILVHHGIRSGEDTESGLRDQLSFVFKALG